MFHYIHNQPINILEISKMVSKSNSSPLNEQLLEVVNEHVRDSAISFEEKGHVYTVKGDKSYTSVTTLVHKLFYPFNENRIIDRMMRSASWPQSKYFGMTKQQIKEEWKKNRIDSTTRGTKLHKYIEDTYNQIEFTEEQKQASIENVEYSYFHSFLQHHKHMKPYRTEWCVYDEEYKISGSIDMTFVHEDGEISIYDWKRCKKIVQDNQYSSFGKPPFREQLPDNNYTHYSLQLNTYKYILEKNYGVKIKDMYLVVFHPENEGNTYVKVEVKNMQPLLKQILDYRTTLMSEFQKVGTSV